MVALIAGGIFFLSWLWQAYITKQAGRSVVDPIFWVARSIGLTVLLFHNYLRDDAGMMILTTAGISLALYNLFKSVREHEC